MEQRGDAPPIAAVGARATARGLLAILEDVPIGSRRSKKLARQEKCAPVGAPSRLLFRLFNARLATARLIDQCGLTALAVLTAPSLDRRLAGNLVLDHGLANRQAVFKSLNYLVTPPVISQYQQLQDIVGKHLDAAVAGTVYPAQALKDMQDDCTKNIGLTK